jgi:hypothetical protein
VHSEGRTRVLEYGDLTVRATPENNGVRTEVDVANTYERDATYSIQISVADGKGWTAYNRFWLQDVPPGKTGRDDAVIGSKKMGPIPQVPKIYVDEFTPSLTGSRSAMPRAPDPGRRHCSRCPAAVHGGQCATHTSHSYRLSQVPVITQAADRPPAERHGELGDQLREL